MRCPECGYSNAHNAKFCVNCGNGITKSTQNTNGVFCTQCGVENPSSSHYCLSCGSRLVASPFIPEKSARKQEVARRLSVKQSHNSWTFRQTMALVIGISIVVLFVLKSMENSDSRTNQVPVSPVTANPVVEARVINVASKFACSCGSCNEQSLDTCTCETAITEKQFIREKLGNGADENQVIAEVLSTYGWLKPEYKAEYGSAPL